MALLSFSLLMARCFWRFATRSLWSQCAAYAYGGNPARFRYLDRLWRHPFSSRRAGVLPATPVKLWFDAGEPARHRSSLRLATACQKGPALIRMATSWHSLKYAPCSVA